MKKEIGGTQISFIFLCILVLMSSCNIKKQKKMKYKDVEYIRFIYLPKEINPLTAIDDCNGIHEYPKQLIKDTIITDIDFIRSFILEIDKLKKNNEKVNYDFRVKCIVYEKEKKREICFGDDYLTVLEGVLMKDSPTLFEILDKTLYK